MRCRTISKVLTKLLSSPRLLLLPLLEVVLMYIGWMGAASALISLLHTAAANHPRPECVQRLLRKS